MEENNRPLYADAMVAVPSSNSLRRHDQVPEVLAGRRPVRGRRQDPVGGDLLHQAFLAEQHAVGGVGVDRRPPDVARLDLLAQRRHRLFLDVDTLGYFFMNGS
jgi:hypothetical protein